MIWKHILQITFLNASKLIPLHTVKQFQAFLSNTINFIFSQWFVYTQLIGQKVLFLTIQLNISHLFAHNLNIKQFYVTHW